MAENWEEQYFKKDKFNSLLEKKDWLWDKRCYDFLIEDALISESVWRNYCKRLAKKRNRKKAI
jgi:hypothetical protein